jgi:hypothetical protein
MCNKPRFSGTCKFKEEHPVLDILLQLLVVSISVGIAWFWASQLSVIIVHGVIGAK